MPKGNRFMSKLLLSFISTLMMMNTVYAQDRLIKKQDFLAPIRVSAVITSSTPFIKNSASNAALEKNALLKSDVFVMNMKLSPHQKAMLRTFNLKRTASATLETPYKLPSRVELGMNDVPVLDQGEHGACATFANTAAIDALLGKGHYISELCSLELGSYLERRSYLPSGWDGSFSGYVLSRLQEFGIVSIDNQRKYACGGVIDYPVSDENNIGVPISPDEYNRVSENINENIYWIPLLTPYERFVSDLQDSHSETLLNEVKLALADSNSTASVRITFGVVLPVNHCSAGACAKYHKTDDTWALTKAIMDDQEPVFGGHEMIITGYNDKAVAMDNEGVMHRGLLILRNSWGNKHGDNGDFYMTYDFFVQYVIEVQKIVKDDILEN
jgi:hypothetical protein